MWGCLAGTDAELNGDLDLPAMVPRATAPLAAAHAVALAALTPNDPQPPAPAHQQLPNPTNDQQQDPITQLHHAFTHGLPVHIQPIDIDTMQALKAAASKLTTPQLVEPLPDGIQFGDQQFHAVNTVKAALRAAKIVITHGPGTTSTAPVIITIQGGPGCGKSLVTKHLVHFLVQEGIAVLVSATTATAARRLGLSPADTTHSACQLPVNGPTNPLRPMCPQTMALELAQLVVVDECSMLTSKLLHLLCHRLSQATKAGDPPKVLLLVGDLAQLPPICSHGRRRRHASAAHKRANRKPSLCHHCHLLRSPVYTQGTHVHLDVVYRQAQDPDFAMFLGEVRHQRPTRERLQQVLGHRYRPMDSLPDLLSTNATILCTHNRDVRAHNETALQWHSQHNPNVTGPIYDVALQHNCPDLLSTSAQPVQQWLRRHGFHHLTKVARGCRVMYTTTTNKASGATNSAMGTVVDIELGEAPPGHPTDQPWVKAIMVRLDATQRTVRVTRTVNSSTRRDGMQYSKDTFPLTLGYAMTAHRCQGATLTGTTILHVRNAFSPAIVYVMLSRVTTRDNIYILGQLQPEDFVPVNDAAFLEEDKEKNEGQEGLEVQELQQEHDGHEEREGQTEDENTEGTSEED